MLNCQQPAEIAPKFLIDRGLSALLNSIPIYPQHVVIAHTITLFQVPQGVYSLSIAVGWLICHTIRTAYLVFSSITFGFACQAEVLP